MAKLKWKIKNEVHHSRSTGRKCEGSYIIRDDGYSYCLRIAGSGTLTGLTLLQSKKIANAHNN